MKHMMIQKVLSQLQTFAHHNKLWGLIYYWVPPIVIMTTIFHLSGKVGIAVTHEFTTDFLIFKTLHMLEYGLLLFLVFRALFWSTRQFIPSASSHKTFVELTPEELNSLLLLSFLITLTYAISDEIHQTYVISRDGSFRDIFVDSIGMLTMVFFIKQAFAKKLKYLSWRTFQNFL